MSLFKKKNFDNRTIFNKIYSARSWNGNESASGRGSDLDQTRILRAKLPILLAELDVRNVLDLPCGDFYWMREVIGNTPLTSYVGGDIVEDLVATNNSNYRNDRISFHVINLTKDPLPDADLLFCRDCLVHLSFSDIQAALDNILSGSFTYVALTTFTSRKRNKDIPTGKWRPLNFQRAPFNFPAPIALIEEGCTEENGRFLDKVLAVWRIDDLRK